MCLYIKHIVMKMHWINVASVTLNLYKIVYWAIFSAWFHYMINLLLYFKPIYIFWKLLGKLSSKREMCLVGRWDQKFEINCYQAAKWEGKLYNEIKACLKRCSVHFAWIQIYWMNKYWSIINDYISNTHSITDSLNLFCTKVIYFSLRILFWMSLKRFKRIFLNSMSLKHPKKNPFKNLLI